MSAHAPAGARGQSRTMERDPGRLPLGVGAVQWRLRSGEEAAPSRKMLEQTARAKGRRFEKPCLGLSKGDDEFEDWLFHFYFFKKSLEFL